MKDPRSEGYIGVTERDLLSRFEEHKKNSSNLHLFRAFSKYNLEIVQLDEGNSDDILKKEFEYRPEPQIGWNLTSGGGLPPNAKFWWNEQHSKATSERMKNNTFKTGKKDSEETRQLKKLSYAKEYDKRSFAQKNKSVEWKTKAALNRKGKGVGSKNSMATEENREKVAASKRGRKRIYRSDGSFYMSKVG